MRAGGGINSVGAMIRIYVRSYSPLLTHTFCQGRKLCVTAVMAETLWQSVTTWSPATVCVSEHPSRESRRRLEFPRENASTRAGNLVAEIRVERTIAASPERVFDWLLDPANLTASPVVRKAGWAKDSSGDGTDVEWVSGYTLPARGGGKVVELVTLQLVRSLLFRAILAGCAKALASP